MAPRRRLTATLPPAPPRPAPGGPGRAGFVLYVGLNGNDATDQVAELAEVAESLRDLARDLLPTAETYTALSLVPGTGTDDVRDLRDRLSHLAPLEAGPARTTADPAETPAAQTA